jgi:ATP-dependent 26S proteasome regulatory subunit
MDLRKAVVFFDEMDALAQTREEDPSDQKESLDVTRQLLTTSMLPKLADLWDRAEVIFLMATNHKQQLDPAITRANRFDLLLCVAPPPWAGKRSSEKLQNILKIAEAIKVEQELSRLVADASPTENLLNLFTVSEVGVFFDQLKRTKNTETLVNALTKYEDRVEFSKVVTQWAENGIALREGQPTKKEYDDDVKGSRRQYYRKEKK